MLLVKNRLIFGLVKKIITTVFKIIYEVLSLLNLQYALIVLCIGLVLFLTGVFNSTPILRTIFFVLLIFSALAGVFSKIYKFIKPKDKKKSQVQIVQRDNNSDFGNEQQGYEQTENNSNYQSPINQNISVQNDYQIPTSIPIQKPVYPKVFVVKQNPNYLMREFEDRYELYYKTDNGYKYVRTDYKRG